jgi:hypothetical protein
MPLETYTQTGVYGQKYFQSELQGYSGLPQFLSTAEVIRPLALWGTDYCATIAPSSDYGLLSVATQQGMFFDVQSGYYSLLVRTPNRATGRYETIFRTAPAGKNLFDPD